MGLYYNPKSIGKHCKSWKGCKEEWNERQMKCERNACFIHILLPLFPLTNAAFLGIIV